MRQATLTCNEGFHAEGHLEMPDAAAATPWPRRAPGERASRFVFRWLATALVRLWEPGDRRLYLHESAHATNASAILEAPAPAPSSWIAGVRAA